MIVALAIFGIAAGTLTSAGFFAVITAIGLINRVADVTKTKGYLLFFEEMIILGAVIGTVLSVFDVRLDWPWMGEGLVPFVTTVATVVFAAIGVVAGMYVGLFVVCLAETTKALPIFIRRVRIGTGLGIVILMIGLGKAIGQLIYYLVLYR